MLGYQITNLSRPHRIAKEKSLTLSCLAIRWWYVWRPQRSVLYYKFYRSRPCMFLYGDSRFVAFSNCGQLASVLIIDVEIGEFVWVFLRKWIKLNASDPDPRLII